MKRAKLHGVPKPRNPVARSPLLGKGGPHGKSRGALRREANVEAAEAASGSEGVRRAMTLSRRDLEEGRMREVYVEALAEGHALTDEQLSASLTETLNAKPKGAGWWVFAYGSLLWNPLFPVRRVAARFGARTASPILPVVARVARQADCAGPRARHSIGVARAAASSTGCRHRARWMSCTCYGGAKW